MKGKAKLKGDGNCEAPSDKKDMACGCDGKSICPYNGCGISYINNKSFGWGFNQNGGGVYACELTKGGEITMWFIPNGEVTCDIEKNKPNPKNWEKYKIVTFTPCPGQFRELQMVINTALCGDWAGGAYDDGTGTKQAMGKKYDGHKFCKARVQDTKNDMNQAYWWINYIKVFKRK